MILTFTSVSRYQYLDFGFLYFSHNPYDNNLLIVLFSTINIFSIILSGVEDGVAFYSSIKHIAAQTGMFHCTGMLTAS